MFYYLWFDILQDHFRWIWIKPEVTSSGLLWRHAMSSNRNLRSIPFNLVCHTTMFWKNCKIPEMGGGPPGLLGPISRKGLPCTLHSHVMTICVEFQLHSLGSSGRDVIWKMGPHGGLRSPRGPYVVMGPIHMLVCVDDSVPSTVMIFDSQMKELSLR